jgi:hypothetical protein
MTRNLETLLKEFTFHYGIDRKLQTTVTTQGWYSNLSPEERTILGKYIADTTGGIAQGLGYKDTAELGEAMGKMFEGIVMGIAAGIETNNAVLS